MVSNSFIGYYKSDERISKGIDRYSIVFNELIFFAAAVALLCSQFTKPVDIFFSEHQKSWWLLVIIFFFPDDLWFMILYSPYFYYHFVSRFIRNKKKYYFTAHSNWVHISFESIYFDWIFFLISFWFIFFENVKFFLLLKIFGTKEWKIFDYYQNDFGGLVGFILPNFIFIFSTIQSINQLCFCQFFSWVFAFFLLLFFQIN